MAKRNIYDIEFEEEWLTTEDGLYNYFYLQELKQRRLVLNDDVEQFSVSTIARHIFFYNIEDSGKPVEDRKPILLYIVTRGGSINDGFELIDIIRNSKTPVYTINLGYAHSMGFLIMLAGHKRLAMPNSTFLLHDGSNFSWNSSAKVQDQIEFHKRMEERIKAYVLDRTNITAREYDKNFRVEWYMFAEEAKAKGVIDGIIGVDADLAAMI